MIVFTATALLCVIALATGLTLIDNWIRGREAFVQLVQERGAARAGFVPVIEAAELRQRSRLPSRHSRRRTGMSPAFTKRARRAPRPAIAPLGEALGAS
ncbi:MAG: hypothetical protein AAGK17_08905 [Pseudomonadota bacterium]